MQPRQRIDDEELRRLYVDLGLSVPEVAKRLGCAQSTVGRHLKRLQVPMRPKGRPHGPVRVAVDTERLLRLYVTEGRGLNAVAAQLCVGRSAVERALDELSIARHPVGRPTRKTHDA